MIAGRVTAQIEAKLTLTMAGPGGQVHHLDFVIDTGFDGFLTLPSQIVRTPRLPMAGNRRVILGDGSTVQLDTYIGVVVWHEDEREILVVQTDGDLVAGMALPYGNRLVMDVIEGGELTNDPLP